MAYLNDQNSRLTRHQRQNTYEIRVNTTPSYITPPNNTQTTNLEIGVDWKTKQQMHSIPKPTTAHKEPPSTKSIKLDQQRATRIEPTTTRSKTSSRRARFCIRTIQRNTVITQPVAYWSTTQTTT